MRDCISSEDPPVDEPADCFLLREAGTEVAYVHPETSLRRTQFSHGDCRLHLSLFFRGG